MPGGPLYHLIPVGLAPRPPSCGAPGPGMSAPWRTLACGCVSAALHHRCALQSGGQRPGGHASDPCDTHQLAGESLAPSSTLAGDLLIMGKIANIIVVDQAARLGLTVSWQDLATGGHSGDHRLPGDRVVPVVDPPPFRRTFGRPAVGVAGSHAPGHTACRRHT